MFSAQACLTCGGLHLYRPECKLLQGVNPSLTREQQCDLDTKRGTATPLWKGFATLLQFRTSSHYKSVGFLGPRFGKEFVYALLVATLYLGVGDSFEPTDNINSAAVLFLWSTLPACAFVLCFADVCISNALS